MLNRKLNFLYKYKNTPKRVFLIDACGALITATSLLGILAQLEYLFGMPRDVLFVLSGIAFCLFLYSIICYRFINTNWKSFLKLLILFNFSYILVTLGMIIKYKAELTIIGLIYFIIELILIGFIISLEFQTITTLKNNNKPAGNNVYN